MRTGGMARTGNDGEGIPPGGTRWWDRGWFLAALVLASAVPLLGPALPPLSDLPGHMARWHISIALQDSSEFARYYDFHWALIPNLGLDLIVPALAPLFGFEFVCKLAIIAIPILTAVGLLWTAREAHGQVPPTAMIAVPLAYAWPFQFGFVNFALSQALALCAFALWIRWGRERRLLVRMIVFTPVACLLWVAHSFGWGMFGLMAAGAELARRRTGGDGWRHAMIATVVQCLPLAVPIVALILMAVPGGGIGASDWFRLPVKVVYALSILRDRWQWFDVGSLLVPFMLLYAALRSNKFGFAPLLAWPAILCAGAFIVLPRAMMGGAYVDMRMAPAALMLALIAIRPVADVRLALRLALLGLLFCGVRLSGTTISFLQRAAEQHRELAAIPAIPRGATVLSLVARPCVGTWSEPRFDQLPGIAIVRRNIFTNTQWALAGQQALRIRYDRAGAFREDPSQSVYALGCAESRPGFAEAIAAFPRAAFSHVWTLGFPPRAARAPDLRVVWTNGTSTLYRVVRAPSRVPDGVR